MSLMNATQQVAIVRTRTDDHSLGADILLSPDATCPVGSASNQRDMASWVWLLTIGAGSIGQILFGHFQGILCECDPFRLTSNKPIPVQKARVKAVMTGVNDDISANQPTRAQPTKPRLTSPRAIPE